MQVSVTGDDEGFDLQVKVKWKVLVAFVEGAVTALVILVTLLSSPAVARFLTWLGW